MERAKFLNEWRPTINLKLKEGKQDKEHFMHTVLRPILKFQNESILYIIKTSTHFDKLTWTDNSDSENRIIINDFIQKNVSLKNQLTGLIIGLMTQIELEFYISNEKELKKRMIEMCVTRFHSQHL